MKEDTIILIAEDDESNFLLFRAILGKSFNIIHAWNGKEAVELFKETNPKLILMDIKMPGMDGYEATQLIRSTCDSIPIIAVTAYAFEEDAERILKMGFDDYLAKPIDRQSLLLLIQKYVKHDE